MAVKLSPHVKPNHPWQLPYRNLEHFKGFTAGRNALNHTNLGTPNRFVNTPQFGTITEAATPGREVQLGARVAF